MSANNKRLVLSILWIVIGVSLIILSALGYMEYDFYSGFGLGLALVGVLQTVRHIRYIRDPEYREKADIENNDERNRYIQMKAWSITGYVTVLGCAASSIALRVLGKTEQASVLVLLMCLIVAVYFISYVIIRKKN